MEDEVETPSFRISIPTDEEFSEYIKSPHILPLDKGEKVYEARSYPGLKEKVMLVILSKIRGDGMIMPLIKFKYPDRQSSFSTQSWSTKEEYEKLVKGLEEHMSSLFDTANPIITPGRHINLYLSKNEGGR